MNHFLTSINNEVPVMGGVMYTAGPMQLDTIVLVLFAHDCTVTLKESAWFGLYMLQHKDVGADGALEGKVEGILILICEHPMNPHLTHLVFSSPVMSLIPLFSLFSLLSHMSQFDSNVLFSHESLWLLPISHYDSKLVMSLIIFPLYFYFLT